MYIISLYIYLGASCILYVSQLLRLHCIIIYIFVIIYHIP